MSENFNSLLGLALSETVPQKKYSEQVGEISIAWNKLHSLMAFWFLVLLKINDKAATALWETAAGDSFQRTMLKSLAPIIKEDRAREEFIWVIDTTDKFGRYRNAVMHIPLRIDPITQEISIENSAKQNHARYVNTLMDKNLFEPLVKDLGLLYGHFLDLVGYYLKVEDMDTWPERPTLQALPALLDQESSKIRQKPKK